MIEAQLITAMAWGRHQLVCHVAKVKYPNIDAFTSKTQGFFAKTEWGTKDLWISCGPLIFLSLPPSNLHNGANVKI